MWIPAGLLLTLVGIALFAAWMGEAERRVGARSSSGLKQAVRTIASDG